MSNIERLQLPTPEEGLRNRRASVTESFHNATRTGGQSIGNLPAFLKAALEVEAWKERPSPLGKTIANSDFSDWLRRPYPQGVDASPDLIRRILADDNEALVMFDRAIAGVPGAPAGNRNAAKGENETKSDNIRDCSESSSKRDKLQYGTSLDAGLRRLRKAAEAGDERATELLHEVTTSDPDKPKKHLRSVHSACQEMGWRPKIDRDVQQRAARALAEWIVEHANGNDLDAVKANLFAAGAKSVAIELTNLLGESIMDRRYGGDV